MAMGSRQARGATIRVDRQRGVAPAPGPEPAELNPVTLRFRDPLLQRALRADYFRHNLGNLRFAFLGGILLWVL